MTRSMFPPVFPARHVAITSLICAPVEAFCSWFMKLRNFPCTPRRTPDLRQGGVGGGGGGGGGGWVGGGGVGGGELAATPDDCRETACL